MSTRFLTMDDGARLRVEAAGDGRPLVFVHGWAADRSFFEAQKAALSDVYQIITFDLRCHGQSSCCDTGPTIERLARDLISVFDQLALEQAVCIGWSMGAMVAWEALYDADFARRLAGLVTIDMSPRITNDADWRLGLSDGREALATLRAADWMRDDWANMAARFTPRIFAKGVSPQMISETLEKIVTLNPQALASLWESMAIKDYRRAIPAISAPMLAIHGARSQLYKAATGEYIARNGRNAQLAVLEQSGHAPHAEEPDAFNATLSQFIDFIDTNSQLRGAPPVAAQ